MESASKSNHAGVGLFMTGVVVGAIATLGLGTEEGRRLSEKLITALKDLASNLNEQGEPGPVSRLPPPPPRTESQV